MALKGRHNIYGFIRDWVGGLSGPKTGTGDLVRRGSVLLAKGVPVARRLRFKGRISFFVVDRPEPKVRRWVDLIRWDHLYSEVVFLVPDVTVSAARERRRLCGRIDEARQRFEAACGRRVVCAWVDLIDGYHQYNSFVSLLGGKRLPVPINYRLENLAESYRRSLRRRSFLRGLKLWKAGEDVDLVYNPGCYLRIRKDEIETSRGDRVPLEDVRRYGPYLLWWIRKAARDLEYFSSHTTKPIRLGRKFVDAVGPENIRVGCTLIDHSEIEEMAAILKIKPKKPVGGMV